MKQANNSSCLSYVCFVNFLFIQTHKQKSNRVRFWFSNSTVPYHSETVTCSYDYHIYIFVSINKLEVPCFERQNELRRQYPHLIRPTCHLLNLCTFLSISEHSVVQVVHSGVRKQDSVCRHVIANAMCVNTRSIFPIIPITFAKWERLIERDPPFHLKQEALWTIKRIYMQYSLPELRWVVSHCILYGCCYSLLRNKKKGYLN